MDLRLQMSSVNDDHKVQRAAAEAAAPCDLNKSCIKHGIKATKPTTPTTSPRRCFFGTSAATGHDSHFNFKFFGVLILRIFNLEI